MTNQYSPLDDDDTAQAEYVRKWNAEHPNARRAGADALLGIGVALCLLLAVVLLTGAWR